MYVGSAGLKYQRAQQISWAANMHTCKAVKINIKQSYKEWEVSLHERSKRLPQLYINSQAIQNTLQV